MCYNQLSYIMQSNQPQNAQPAPAPGTVGVSQLAAMYGVSLETMNVELQRIKDKLKRWQPGKRLIWPCDFEVIVAELGKPRQ